jgi:hypothetical protein
LAEKDVRLVGQLTSLDGVNDTVHGDEQQADL